MAISRIVAALTLALVCQLGPVGTASAQDASAACAEIRQACLDAGFTQGGGKSGKGVRQHCVDVLLGGKAKRKAGDLALPQVDPALTAACANEPGAAAPARSESASAAAGRAIAEPPAQPAKLASGVKPGPNFVFVLTDDFAMNLISTRGGVLEKSMPNVARMMREGATFSNYFVTNALCCPSRTSIFTGKLPHNSGVLTNRPPFGGVGVFIAKGNEADTFAVALQKLSYRTAMMGKYINGYDPKEHPVPPGWSDWAVSGGGYDQFDYFLNVNNKVSKQPEYLTDKIASLGTAFVQSAAGGPFFLELATFAPHAPFVPPERYKNAFPEISYFQTPAYGARPDAAAPEWLQVVPPLTRREEQKINEVFRDRVRSNKAIDDMIGTIRAELDRLGVADTTYVIFSSDNGFHLGEYSLRQGKETPFDIDINVPLIVVGPGVAGGQVIDEIVMNIDLFPTIAELAGAPPPATADGTSFAGLLHGGQQAWRQMAVVENYFRVPDNADPDVQPQKAGTPPSYVALRLKEEMFVEYAESGEIGYYDMRTDPYQLHNVAATLSAERLAAFRAAVVANKTCKGSRSCWEAQSLTP